MGKPLPFRALNIRIKADKTYPLLFFLSFAFLVEGKQYAPLSFNLITCVHSIGREGQCICNLHWLVVGAYL